VGIISCRDSEGIRYVSVERFIVFVTAGRYEPKTDLAREDPLSPETRTRRKKR
jgi:hypothetical protein